MNKTKIEYLDFSWNPLAMRCTPCSPGCDHCWHLRMCKRMAFNPKLPMMETLAYLGAEPPIITHRLTDPLKIKKPARIAVQLMGDLFHDSVKDEMILEVFWVMQRCGQHTFFVLTKRPIRLQKFVDGALIHPHVWLGVTVCNQEEADEKIPILLSIPAAHRWVSYEPALEWVNFRGKDYRPIQTPYLDWIVAGAETGPGARPAENRWFRSVLGQCREVGIPFFMKKTTGDTPEDLRVRELPE